MKLAMRAVVILCVMVAVIVLASSSTRQMPSCVCTAGAMPGVAIVRAAFANFWTAAQELWEIARTNNLGIWHLVVVVLAVLIPRRIIAALLR